MMTLLLAAALNYQSACITGPEFDDLHVGMTRPAVERVLDGPGHRGVQLFDRSVLRQYRICGKSWTEGVVVVRYIGPLDDLRVDDYVWFEAI